MKKLFLLLLFLFIPKVDALTYSDYSSFSEFTDSPTQSNALVDVITEKRYKYYKLNKEEGPYLLADAVSDYQYIDYDDYILSEPSDILYEKPDEINKVIITEKQYKYQRVSPVNYLQINLSKNTSSSIQIKSLRIYNKTENITDYDIVGYYTNYDPEISSGRLDPNGWIKIRLHDNFYLEDLKIVLELDGNYNNVEYTYESGYDDKVYTKNKFKYQNTVNLNKEFLFKNSTLQNPKFEYFYDSEREESNVLQKTSETRTIYRYQDKLYRHYNLEKIYNDKYTKEPDGDFIYRDEDDYKIYYAYRTRSLIKENLLNVSSTHINNLSPSGDLKLDTNTLEFKENKVKDKIIGENNSVSNVYQKPLKKIEYQKANILDNQNTENNNLFYLLYFLIFFILSIIILLLSKYYKSKVNYGKV